MNKFNKITILVLGFLLLTSGVWAANNPNLFVAMGDGITKGSPPTIGNPWPPILQSMMGKTVVNAGKSGSRVGYGSYRVAGILADLQPGYLLILYGTNDSGINNSIDYIIGELRVMIRAAKSRLTIPVIGTLPPAFNGYGSGLSALSSRIRQLAASEGIQCADVSRAFNNNRNLIMYDGLHPTPEGQRLIASTFLSAIRKATPIVPPAPPAPPAPSISPSLRVHGSAEESGTITVTAASTISWTAATSNAWITINSGASGTGNGSIQYTVQANATAIYRTGRIQAASKVFLIRQAGLLANLALASRGSTIQGNNGRNWGALIDGIFWGYTTTAGYGCTYWTGAAYAPGSMVLDLKSTCTISGTSLLLWDLDSRYHSYKIDTSVDGVSWTTIIDRTSGQYQSWQDVEFEPLRARYLRFTGTYCNTGSGIAVVEWEVYGTPGAAFTPAHVILAKEEGSSTLNVTAPSDYAWTATTTDDWLTITSGESSTGSASIAYSFTANSNASPRTGIIIIDEQHFVIEQKGLYGNLALASRGSTITGSNGGRWGELIDGIISGYTKRTGYGFTFWRNAAKAPGVMTLDLKELCTVDRIRMLLWNSDSRYYRYRIDASANGVSWVTVVNRTSGKWKGWQDIALSPRQVRYLRLTGAYCSAADVFTVVEWEVYGSPVPPVSSAGTGGSATKGKVLITQQPPPSLILSSAGEEPNTNAWNMVDRNSETLWAGNALDKGWWVALGYDEPINISHVELELGEHSTTNVTYLISEDAKTWQDLEKLPDGGLPALRYLWLIFPDEGTGKTPVIREIRLQNAEY
ncbi:MAG: discoidin domain-containing protein [Lentisphaerota bacterium]